MQNNIRKCKTLTKVETNVHIIKQNHITVTIAIPETNVHSWEEIIEMLNTLTNTEPNLEAAKHFLQEPAQMYRKGNVPTQGLNS